MNGPLFSFQSQANERPFRELWPHQVRALQALREAMMTGERRIILQAPTGSGKTALSAEMVRGALAKDRRVIFTVPYLSLVEQTVAAFEAEGIDAIGVIQGIHERTNRYQPVQVCSVQTLERRKIPAADLVIVDEAHRQFRFVNSWLGEPEWARVPFVGLTASPWARGMGKHWGQLIVAATTAELIEAGRLSPFKVYAPSHPDLSQVKIVSGDYHEGELSGVMSERKLVADVVETWKRLGTPDKTLCFAVDRAHAAHLQREFCEAGVDCAYIDAYTDDAEREAIKRKFHASRNEVVVSIGTMIAGIDWDVRCISWCRPTKSEIVWVQAFGRALRLGKDKSHAIILDHADTALTLGLPTDIHHPRLDDGKTKTAEQKAREPKTPLPKECKACGFVKPPKAHQCPSCGYRPEKQSEIIVEDGELVEFGTAAKQKEKHSAADKQRWWSMLQGYAAKRGKSGKWVLAQYRQKFGTWPRGLSDEPMPPDGACMSFIRSRNIAWAKSRGRAPHAA